MLILVAVETGSSMKEYGTDALIIRRLRHILEVRQVKFRNLPRDCATRSGESEDMDAARG